MKINFQRLNSTVNCEAICVHISSANAFEILARFDVIVDCSDNPATRYLLNDAAVLLVFLFL